MKPIGMVTFATPKSYLKTVEPGIESKIDYCSEWGYHFLDDVDDVLDVSRPPAWSKIRMLLKYMDKGYNILFWSDADTIIANPSIRLESIVEDSGMAKDHEILMTRDPRGNINTGNFFVLGSEWSAHFLKDVYDWDGPKDTRWYEQLAVLQLFMKNHLDVRKKAHMENRTWKFNAYPWEKNAIQKKGIPEIGLYHHGDFLVHFLDIQGEELRKLMNNFMLNHNSYPPRKENYTPQEMDTLFWCMGKKRDVDFIPEKYLV